MTALILKKTTLLKQRLAPREQLTASEQITIGKPGMVARYELKAIAHVSGHVKMTFADPLPGTKFNTWLMFAADGEIVNGKGTAIAAPTAAGNIHLSAPFFCQYATSNEPTRKSRWEQGRTCFTSSNAMAARYLGANISGDDDYYFNHIVPTGLDTTEPESHTRALSGLGFKTEHRTDMTFADLDRQLEKGYPVPIGILHHGSLANPEGGGHWICVIGRTIGSNGQVLYECNDPAGELDVNWGGYSGDPNLGDRVLYSKRTLSARWTVEGDGSGYGRIYSNRLN